MAGLLLTTAGGILTTGTISAPGILTTIGGVISAPILAPVAIVAGAVSVAGVVVAGTVAIINEVTKKEELAMTTTLISTPSYEYKREPKPVPVAKCIVVPDIWPISVPSCETEKMKEVENEELKWLQLIFKTDYLLTIKEETLWKLIMAAKEIKIKKKTSAVALDCEFVEGEINGKVEKKILGRVSIVDQHLKCIFDKYVQLPPGAKNINYKTEISGLKQSDLEKGIPFAQAREEVRQIIDGKIVVGHSLYHDFKALDIVHPPEFTRDTSIFFRLLFGTESTPSLAALALQYLGVNIRRKGISHDSVMDARIAMCLYMLFLKEWEIE